MNGRFEEFVWIALLVYTLKMVFLIVFWGATIAFYAILAVAEFMIEFIRLNGGTKR